MNTHEKLMASRLLGEMEKIAGVLQRKIPGLGLGGHMRGAREQGVSPLRRAQDKVQGAVQPAMDAYYSSPTAQRAGQAAGQALNPASGGVAGAVVRNRLQSVPTDARAPTMMQGGGVAGSLFNRWQTRRQ